MSRCLDSGTGSGWVKVRGCLGVEESGIDEDLLKIDTIFHFYQI